MATAERLTALGARRATRFLLQLGDEFRERRLSLGLSQQQVADAAGISRSAYSRIENGKLGHLSILVAARISSVLGLELAVRAYPGGVALRTPAHDARLRRVLDHVAPPLTQRTEVPLPQRPDAPTEQRAWDAMISGRGRRTGMELEMRLQDVQALERRIRLKLRDDPVDAFVLLVADTRHNRQVLAATPEIVGLRRQQLRVVADSLRAGQHPPSGIVLV